VNHLVDLYLRRNRRRDYVRVSDVVLRAEQGASDRDKQGIAIDKHAVDVERPVDNVDAEDLEADRMLGNVRCYRFEYASGERRLVCLLADNYAFNFVRHDCLLVVLSGCAIS
jgi:hypothetical protein